MGQCCSADPSGINIKNYKSSNLMFLGGYTDSVLSHSTSETNEELLHLHLLPRLPLLCCCLFWWNNKHHYLTACWIETSQSLLPYPHPRWQRTSKKCYFSFDVFCHQKKNGIFLSCWMRRNSTTKVRAVITPNVSARMFKVWEVEPSSEQQG